ncbi:unnamed protein product [Bursaphelenchus okinawaensis]|uniref:Uncharacterized protein n=1 Tax=Bursaphelenchus okinawaensis TaxID=465554 RepID=A0A811JQL3_9BILA|nr:unnamed protein product [Bursaphelenchus okinawaensis]CAG9077517.1 unnamed protein product [Bursaphelenchus okinawaensis]
MNKLLILLLAITSLTVTAENRAKRQLLSVLAAENAARRAEINSAVATNLAMATANAARIRAQNTALIEQQMIANNARRTALAAQANANLNAAELRAAANTARMGMGYPFMYG